MKKNYFKSLLAIFSVVAIMTACKNNNNEPDPFRPPTKAQYDNLINKALKNITQTKTFKAEDGIVFKSKNGAVLTINGNSLVDDKGNTVEGEVELTFIEIYDRGNMVVTNKPVMGLDKDARKPRPLITGGQYSIEIRQGNKELPGVSHNITVPGSLTGGVNPEMKLWDGIIDDETGNLVYEEVEVGEAAGMKTTNENYEIFNNRFGWTNIDIFWNYEGPKTQIKVVVPTGYNGDNSGVFIAYEGQNNLLAQLDVYDKTEKFFTEHYGFIPVGEKIHLIFVSESNGSVTYAIKSLTIVADQTITVAQSELQVGSLDEVVDLINDLD